MFYVFYLNGCLASCYITNLCNGFASRMLICYIFVPILKSYIVFCVQETDLHGFSERDTAKAREKLQHLVSQADDIRYVSGRE